MIRHSVIFKLKSQISATEKTNFFEAVNQLAKIEGVEQFEVLEQISKKTILNTAFRWNLPMLNSMKIIQITLLICILLKIFG